MTIMFRCIVCMELTYLEIPFGQHWPMSQCSQHVPIRWQIASNRTAVEWLQTHIHPWNVAAANHRSLSTLTYTNSSFANTVWPHRPIPYHGIPNFSNRIRYFYKLYDIGMHSNGIWPINSESTQSNEINSETFSGAKQKKRRGKKSHWNDGATN